MCYDEDIEKLEVPNIPIGHAEDYEMQSHKLFSSLRNADEQGFEIVYAHCPKTDGMGLAVYNRIIRAAGFEVIAI